MIKQLGGDITNSQEMVRWGVLGVESKIINTNSSHSLVKCDEYGIDQPTITNDSEMNDDVKIMMTTDEHCDANLTPLDQGLLLLLHRKFYFLLIHLMLAFFSCMSFQV